MRFLKRDVNTSLLLFITFFLVMFISFTIYYEYKLRGIVAEKNINEEMLGEITARMTFEQLNSSARLKQLALVNKTIAEKELLEQKYNELAEQNENIRKEKEALQNQTSLLKSEMEYQKIKLDGPTAQFRMIQDKNEEIKQLGERIKELCLMLKNNNLSNKECG